MRNNFYTRSLLIFLICLSGYQLQAQELKSSALRQMQSLIDDKEARTPVQKKISSQLLYAARMERGEPVTADVATLEVNVDKGSDGLVAVTIKAIVTDGLIKSIVQGGGEIITRSDLFNQVVARIPLQSIEAIATSDLVKNISPSAKPMHADIRRNAKNNTSFIPARRIVGESPFYAGYTDKRFNRDFAARAERVRSQLKLILASEKFKQPEFIGAATSEGDITHKANLARTAFGVNGQGIKIGVLSNSYNQLNQAAANVTAGDLPGVGNPNGFTTPVTVLSDITNATQAIDEGRAMLQIVHDLAPGAELFFATAFISEPSFAQGILDLRAAGCNIICDDVFYLDEPPFQDGIVAQAVNVVTASGALYFSSAGNQGNKNDNTSSVWEGDFTDGGAASSPIPAGDLHIFSAGVTNNQVTFDGGNAAFLFWSDPLAGSGNDYDLFVLNNALTTVVGSSTDIQDGNDDPLEGVAGSSIGTSNRFVILKKAGAAVRALHLNTFGSGIAFNTAGQTHGHGSAAEAYSVAATDADGPFPGVFTGSSIVENFSSDGTRRKFYNPNGTPVTPGNFLFATNGGTVLQKPDITAADGTITTVPGFQPFFGTSAAAPHAAAIAALLKQRSPILTNAQIRTILTTTAIDIEAPGTDRDAGFGIVMALEALTAVSGAPGILFTGATLVSETCTPTNGVIDPGESVTVSFCVRNFGGAPTTNLVGNLLATGGVTTASSQNYGVLTVGAAPTCRNFTFTNNGTCGGTVTMSVQFQDGALDLGTFTFTFQIGVPVTTFTQNFDAVTAPALPAGWTTSSTGAAGPWVTSTAIPFSAPNCAFGTEVATPSATNLVSPTIAIANAGARLSFRNLYNLESGFDGELLEIKIGAGAFQDIITAGGSFVSGGYNGVLDPSTDFPNRSAWTGLSGGTTAAPTYILTVVNLPAAAVGQSVQFRWIVSSDLGTVAAGAPGVKIDNISITDGATCCVAAGPPPTVTINQAAAQADPTSVSPINFTVVFSEAVTGFTSSDISFTGSTAGGTLVAVVTGSGTTYNVAVAGMTTSGLVVASIPAGAATSAAGGVSLASTSTDNQVTYIAPPVTVTINQAAAQVDPTSVAPINFTVVFSEPVTGFTATDISFAGSTAGGTLVAVVTGSGTTYNVAVSGMNASGLVVASVPAGSAVNAGGSPNVASTSTDNQVTYNAPPLTVTINQAVGQPDPTATSPINYTVVFSEAVTGFTSGDVSIAGTALATTAIVTGSGTTYNVAVSGMTGTGTVIASIPAAVAVSVGGTPNQASTSTDNTVTYLFGPPTVTIDQAVGQADPTPNPVINFTAVFNEPVTGFTTGDVVISGTAGATTAIVTGSGTTYNVAVSGMSVSGTVIVNIPAGVAVDINGSPNAASTSTDNTVTFISCVLVCPANITVNNTAGQCGAIVSYPSPTTTGSCGTVSATPISGSFFPVGTTTVNVSTSAGATCTFTITVNDVTPPTVTCPADITINNTPGLCTGVASFATPVATDNCTSPVSDFANTWSNSGQRGVFFDVRNTGSTPIVINSISPAMWATAALADVFSIYITTSASTYSGNQGVAANWTLNTSSAVNFPGGTLPVQVNVPLTTPLILAPGQSKGVYVVGTQSFGGGPVAYLSSLGAPAYTGPQTYQSGPLQFSGGIGSSGLFSGFFGTGLPGDIRLFYGSISYGPVTNQTGGLPSGSAFPVGVTINTFTATDPAGNTATCTFRVTVLDVQAPTITCPANVTVTTPSGSCQVVVNYTTPIGSDNCPGVTVSRTAGLASGSSFPIGVNTVTWRATDASGNITNCSFTVTVVDGSLPVITTQPANRTVCAGSNATFNVTATSASPLTYQWQQWNGTAWVDIAGQNAATLTLTAVTQGMNTNTYRVNVIGICSAVTSAAATLFVNPLPTITIAAGNTNSVVLLPTQTTSIVATVSPTGGTFAWFRNGAPRTPTVTGNTLSNLTANDAGTYRAVYTDLNGCVNTSNDVVIIAEAADNFYIAPNPNSGQFTIRYFNSANEAVTVSVFDAKGRRVYQKAVTTGTLPFTSIIINLNEVAVAAPGVYIVELRGANGERIGRKQMIVAHR